MNSPSILVVEDNKTTQETLKRELTDLGFQIHQCYSSEDAWGFLEKNVVPNIVVLDFHLPGEDGPGFYRKVSIDKRFKDMVVIPFTALVEDARMEGKTKVALHNSTIPLQGNETMGVVSKGGNEEVHVVPGILLLSISIALQKIGLRKPPQLVKALRAYLEQLSGETDK